MPVEVKVLSTKMKDKQGHLYDMDVYVGNVTKTIAPASDDSNEEENENENDGE